MKKTNPLVVVLGLLFAFFFWLLPKVQPQADELSESAEVGGIDAQASTTAANLEPASMESSAGVFRRPANRAKDPQMGVREQECTIALRNVAGDLLSNGLVFLQAEEGEMNKDSAWTQPNKDGLFHLLAPNTATWIHAQAPGYWAKVVAWNSTTALQQVVELEAITDFQEVQCVDFLTKQPLANVRLQSRSNRSDRYLHWRGNVVSDAAGKVQIPRFDEEYISLEVRAEENQGLIASQFEVSLVTATIPLFRISQVTLTVQNEEGVALPSSSVGSERLHLYHDQTPRANMDLLQQQATCDVQGEATLLLAIGLEQTVWVNHPEYGLHKQTFTPTSVTEVLSFSLPKPSPLVLAIDLPSGISQESLTANVRFQDRRKDEPLLRGADGFFTLPTPSSVAQVTFNAPGCQSLLGYLRNHEADTTAAVDQATGFVRFTMQRGFDVVGTALHADGTAAAVSCYLWPADVEPPTPKPSEQQDASAWTWMLAAPHVPLDTKPDGSFLFQGLAEGTYVLDVLLDENMPGISAALCTYVAGQDMISVPQAEPVTVVLPKLIDCEIRVVNAATQEPIKQFALHRKRKDNGMFGLPGNTANGLIRGWLPVDQLDDILVKADGYNYAKLQQAKLDSSTTPWQLQAKLQPLTAGSISALFELPLLESDTQQAKSADAANTILFGVSVNEPAHWSEFYYLKSGVAQRLPVPMDGSTILEVYIRNRELRQRFRVEPKFITYQPGQDITVSVVAIESEEH
jgi:hypothetical protein